MIFALGNVVSIVNNIYEVSVKERSVVFLTIVIIEGRSIGRLLKSLCNKQREKYDLENQINEFEIHFQVE